MFFYFYIFYTSYAYQKNPPLTSHWTWIILNNAYAPKKPQVHLTSSISNVHILETLKITKCHRRFNFDFINIDFDNIVIEDVKYLRYSFNGDVIFILAPVKTGIPYAYGKAMDSMDKIYDGHAWCKTNTTNTRNEFGLTVHRSSCVGHLQCPNDSCKCLSRNGGVRNSTKWIGITPTPFMVGTNPPKKRDVQCKVCHADPICLDVCYAKIIYAHSQLSSVSRVCIHNNTTSFIISMLCPWVDWSWPMTKSSSTLLSLVIYCVNWNLCDKMIIICTQMTNTKTC